MIIQERRVSGRCGQVIHEILKRRGLMIGLSTVHRVLDRNGLTNAWGKWKKRHIYPPRPIPEKPGILVELDTIHDGVWGERLYVYTLIDVCSRWAFAQPSLKINTHRSLYFVRVAQDTAPFSFQTIQSDNGQEFSKYFTTMINVSTISHRHTRVRKPNDNAHLERFNRTLQDECLRRIPRSLSIWQKEIPEYLRYYNHQRLHMGINYLTPVEKLNQVFPRS